MICQPLRFGFIALLFIFAQSMLPANASSRLALVIGNANYEVQPLDNPINDANAIAKKLTSMGFSVTRHIDLKRDDIGLVTDSFLSQISPGDDVVFFYAGHGVQLNGANYLLATDAVIRSENDVSRNSISVPDLLTRLDKSRAAVKLIFLDACRNNPYVGAFRGGSNRGLAKIGGAPAGTLISFATQPGGVASDGAGQNGLYTEQLLAHIGTPGLPIEQTLKRVSQTTFARSGGLQRPWIEGSLFGDFVFTKRVVQARVVTQPPLKPTTKTSSKTTLEDQAWEIAEQSQSSVVLRSFLQEFPDSSRAPLARVKLAMLSSKPKPVGIKLEPTTPALTPNPSSAPTNQASASVKAPATQVAALTSKPESSTQIPMLTQETIGSRFSASQGIYEIIVRWTGKSLAIEKFDADYRKLDPAWDMNHYQCKEWFGESELPVTLTDGKASFARWCSDADAPGNQIIGTFPSFDIVSDADVGGEKGMIFKPIQ